MHLPYFMRRVNRVFTNPLMGTFAWLVPPLAVVDHVGRKSGRRYRSPVVAFRTQDGFVIPMTYGRDVDWARNIVKARGCELERMGRRFPLRNPRIVGIEGAARDLPSTVRPALKLANLPGYVLLDLDEKARPAGSPKRRSPSSRRGGKRR
jgi:deazaflavin-dependent oxidoreductase (nitroreductase family)